MKRSHHIQLWIFTLLLSGVWLACSSSSPETKEDTVGATEKLVAIDSDNAAEVSEGNEADLDQAETENSATIGDVDSTEGEKEEDLLSDTADPEAAGSPSEEGLPAEMDGNIAPDLMGTQEENIEKIAQKAAEEAGIPLEQSAAPATDGSLPPVVDTPPAAGPTDTTPVAMESSPVPTPGAEAVNTSAPAPQGQDLAAQLSTVKWVGYRFEKGKGLLTIEILNSLPTDYDVFSATDRRRESGFLFRFYQSRLSRKLRYALDSSEFCSPISAISMFENTDSGYVDVFVKHDPKFRELAEQGQLTEGTPGGSLGRGSVRLVFNIPSCEENAPREKLAVKDKAISLLVGNATPFAKQFEQKSLPRSRVGLVRKAAPTSSDSSSIAHKIRQRPSHRVDKNGLPESFDRTLARSTTQVRSSLRIIRSSMMGVAADEIPEVGEPANTAEMNPAANAAPVEDPAPVVPAAEPEMTAAPTEVPAAAMPEEPARDMTGQATPDPVGGRAYTGKAVALDFYDAPLSLVLASLKEQTGHTYIYTDVVGQTRVTVHFNNVPWDEALEAILQTYGLASARIGDSIVRIDQITEIAKTKQARDDAEKATSTQVLVFPLNHAKADEVEPRLTALLAGSGAKITTDKRTNKVIIEASRKTIAKVKEIIKRLDTETPQVEIVSRIVEVRKSFSNQFGISWLNNLNFDPGRALGFGTLNFPNSLTSNFAVDPGVSTDATSGAARFRFGSLNKFIDLDLLLKMEEKKGTTNILQSNRVLVLDNESATIKQGTKRENIQQAAAQVGGIAAAAAPPAAPEAFLSLEVTPQVSAANTVRMKLKITSDNFLDAANSPIQTTSKKELTTNMLRGSGETGVIGGIYDTKKAVSLRGVPFLSDIPILGALFRRSLTEEEQSELLIMVTPTIMPTESGSTEDEVAALKNPLEWKEESIFSQKDSTGKNPSAKF